MNILKKIGERFPQKLQHLPIEKFVDAEGVIDTTGYVRALSRRQTGLGALAVGGVGVGGGLAYRKLQSNKSEFAQQPEKKKGLSNVQKVGLGLGGTAAAVSTGAYMHRRNRLKSSGPVDTNWDKLVDESADLLNKTKNIPKTRAARVLNKIDDVWM